MSLSAGFSLGGTPSGPSTRLRVVRFALLTAESCSIVDEQAHLLWRHPVTRGWTLSCFHLLAVVENAAIGVQRWGRVRFFELVLSFLRYTPRRELPGWMVVLFLTFGEPHTVCIVATAAAFASADIHREVGSPIPPSPRLPTCGPPEPGRVRVRSTGVEH